MSARQHDEQAQDPWATRQPQPPLVPAQPGPPSWQRGPAPGQPGYQVVVSPKTAGIAVLLTFLWLGAGHLYAGRTATGVTLLVVDFFLVLLFLVPFVGWVLAPMIWIPFFVVSAITASSAVQSYNRRIGWHHR